MDQEHIKDTTRPGALVVTFDEVTRKDVSLVGGKNASIGEMIVGLGTKGIEVPPGFATTARACQGTKRIHD